MAIFSSSKRKKESLSGGKDAKDAAAASINGTAPQGQGQGQLQGQGQGGSYSATAGVGPGGGNSLQSTSGSGQGRPKSPHAPPPLTGGGGGGGGGTTTLAGPGAAAQHTPSSSIQSSLLMLSHPHAPSSQSQPQPHSQAERRFPSTASSLTSLPPSSQPTARSVSQLSSPSPPESSPPAYPWTRRPLHLLPPLLSPSPDIPSTTYTTPSPPPFPRYGHSVNPVALSNGDLYIFGGLVANVVKNDLYVVNCAVAGPTAGAITAGLVESRGEVPCMRVGHASVGVGNVLVVWGGDTKRTVEERQDDMLYLFNTGTKEWTRVKTVGPVPEGRYGHAAAMSGSKFFVFGGQKDDGGFMNDLAWFDLSKLKGGVPRWSFVDYSSDAIVPPKRTGHSMITHGDSIYVFGGTDGQYHYNDTWQYDTNTQLWAELSCIGYIPVPREGHAASLVDDVMYVFGGRGVDGKDLEDLAAFNITHQRWFMFQNMGPAPSGRSGHAMATWHHKVFVLGGESYSSPQRLDDAHFVHVLDTRKIKYPAQQAQPVARKSSMPSTTSPNLGTSPALVQQQSQQQSQTFSSPPIGFNTSPNSLTEFHSADEIHPPNLNNNNLNSSNTSRVASPSFNKPPNPLQAKPSSSSSATKLSTSGANGSVPPVRPARPAEDLSLSSLPSRAMSPTTTRAISPTPFSAPQQRAMSPALVNVARYAVANRSASPLGGGGGGGGGGDEGQEAMMSSPSLGGPPPQDAFYYGPRTTSVRATGGSPPLSQVNSQSQMGAGAGVGAGAEGAKAREKEKEREEEIKGLRERETWLKMALESARKKGFVLPLGAGGAFLEQEGKEGSGRERLEDGSDRHAEVVGVLLALKGELARAKMALSEQAHSVDDRLAAATRGRAAALQEASYYRSKLAALESGSIGDATKLDRERTLDLEKKLAESLSTRADLERHVQQLELDVGRHVEMKDSVEERHAAAINRADASEGSYARSLSDYAELQRRVHAQDTTIQDGFEKIAGLTSANRQLEAENKHLKSLVETSEASLAQYLRTLEQTQVALSAANAKNDEVHGVWQHSQSELLEHQTLVQQLRSEVDSKAAEAHAAIARCGDLERVLKATQTEHEATAALAAGGLAELVAAHRDSQSRDTSALEVHTERIRSLEEETETIRRLHQDARTKGDSMAVELDEIRSREVALQTQVLQLRSEVASLRDQHAHELDEVAVHKSTVIAREADVREATKAREAAEVKSSLLRNLMSDHGLLVNDEELATKSPVLNGNETPEQLYRRVSDLEVRLEQRTRTQRELETSLEEARRDAAETEARYQEAARMRGAAEEQMAALRSGGALGQGEGERDVSERAIKAEGELDALQGRHRHLEQTHLKAVQYVKGTEKMLRRMKEELTRYKERCDSLEGELKTKESMPAELKAHMESMTLQIQELTATSSRSAAENESLEQSMQTLRQDFDRRLREEQDSSTSQIQSLQAELARLDADLQQALRNVAETNAVNASLNQELTAALNPASPRTIAVGAGAPNEEQLKRLEQELTLAQNNAEWLKRENNELEQRCLVAEQKIGILLDHMEGTGGEGDFGEHSENESHLDGEGRLPRNWSGVASDAASEYSEQEEQRPRP